MINKLTRLGRVRKMGVVFATHNPADLNNLSQLTNTKIAMRSPRCLNAWLNTPGPTPRAEPPWRRVLSTGHTPWPSKLCRPRRGTEESSNSPTLFQRGSESSLTPSLRCLRRGFRLVAKRHTSVFLDGSRTPAVRLGRGGEAQDPRLQRGPASLGTSASSRRLSGRRGASVLRRLTEAPPQWWAGAFSGVFGF